MPKMRAVVASTLGPIENYSIMEIDCPTPAEDEVQIEVKRAGVTFVDALIASGRHQTKVALPFIPGNEVSGLVVAVGAGVSRLKVGDRVACTGVGGKFAELVNTREASTVRIPDSMSFDEASVFLGSYCCSYHALVQGALLKPGETVLVMGAAGAIGNAAIQIATALGARVLASASTPEKRAAAMRAGAFAAVDAHSPQWRDQVRQLTGLSGLDVVVDPVGGKATEQAFRALGIGGRHLMIGFASGSIPSLPCNLPLIKGASLIGIELSKFTQRFAALSAANDQALVELYQRGALKASRMAHVFEFGRFGDALRLAESGKGFGGIVLHVRA